jgi:hypothetical protein
MPDTDFGQWDGQERREVRIPADGTVPVALLQYLDSRMDAKFAKSAADLRAHTVEEMERYDAIIAKLDELNRASEVRNSLLIQQISLLNGRADKVDAAFASDDKGNPDYSGHRTDHQTRKRFGDWLDGTKRSVGTKIIEWSAVVLMAYMVYKLWPHLLMPAVAPGM